jgi:hypothetical protein
MICLVWWIVLFCVGPKFSLCLHLAARLTQLLLLPAMCVRASQTDHQLLLHGILKVHLAAIFNEKMKYPAINTHITLQPTKTMWHFFLFCFAFVYAI